MPARPVRRLAKQQPSAAPTRQASARGPARPSTRAPTRAPTAAALEAADRLHSAAIHLLRRVRREDTSAGISAPQLSALSVIVFRGPLTLGELAHAEQVRPPTITRIVADLERAGLALRSPRETDRRVTVVRVTARGKRLLEEGRRRRIAALAAEIVTLPTRDVAMIERALDVLERLVGPRMPHAP